MRVAGVHGLGDVSSASRKQNDPGAVELDRDELQQTTFSNRCLVILPPSLPTLFFRLQRRPLLALDDAPRVLSPLYLARALSGTQRSSARPRVHRGCAILGLVSVGLGAVLALALLTLSRPYHVCHSNNSTVFRHPRSRRRSPIFTQRCASLRSACDDAW
jgi:hypothetical protein